MDTKRSLGQYNTPMLTVNYMVKRLLSFFPHGDPIRILDPAVGDGAFIYSLLEHGVPRESLLAFDIDDSVLKDLPIEGIHQDFLRHSPFNIDAIIGNPPYKSKRESSYIRQHRPYLEAQFGEMGIQNMYMMFTVQAIRDLREGGILCFIVQDSFLTNVYYKKFRQFLLDHCLIHEITLAPRRLFHQKNADVRTAIIVLQKCSGPDNETRRRQHQMKLVDRLADEAEYTAPPEAKLQYVPQEAFFNMENHMFFINVSDGIIEIVRDCPRRLGDVVQGGTGISTGNDRLFLRKENMDALSSDNEDWVPFYKNGGGKNAWYYETPYRIQRDWQTKSKLHADFIARNSDFYFREGITCSSMGIEFSAAYLPAGCLFGVNANFFTDSRQHLFYVLALLNSTFIKYLLRAVYNRTNMLTAGYIKRLPYIEPAPALKQQVAQVAEAIVKNKMSDPPYHPGALQAVIDELVFDTYGINEADRILVRQFCSNLFESL